MTLSKLLFFATAVVTTIFIITILAMVATLAEDPQTPINQWFNQFGKIVLTIQVVGIGILGMAAMIADRRETLKNERQKKDDSEPPE